MKQMMKKRISQLLRFSRLLLPYWDKQVVLYLCAGFSLLIGLIQPYLSRLIIDFAFLGKDLYLFHVLILAGAILYLFSIPIELIQKQAGFYLRTRVSFSLRSRFYRHMQLLSLRFAQSRSTGEHLYRLGPDLEAVVGLIVEALPSLFLAPLRILLLLGICLWLSWPLTAAILLVCPLIYLHTHFFTRRQYALGKEITRSSQDVASRLQEAVSLMKWIKIFGKERSEYKRYLGDLISLIRLHVRNLKISLFQSQSSRFLNAVLVGGLTYILGFQVIQGSLTLGMMTALSIYLFQLLSALKAMGTLYNDIVLKFIALDRVVQTLDTEVEVRESPHATGIRRLKGGIRFEEVSFGYSEAKPVLKDICFEIAPGEKIALVGPSGAGKTTLAHLLIRLYDPRSGKIRIDGHNLRDLRIAQLRKKIGFVSHDPFCLNRSITENIRFGKPGATEEEVIRAAKVAGAHEFITALPEGYESRIGEGSHTLSQGEKQRIALARVLLIDPGILVLDEAMSAINSDGEQRILSSLRDHERAWTILIISHRLSAIREADRVLVINDGRIEQEGTHPELIKTHGLYQRLFREQLFETEIRNTTAATPAVFVERRFLDVV
jgi:ATP-binding cassette, subfamily B, bacterial MsbA